MRLTSLAMDLIRAARPLGPRVGRWVVAALLVGTAGCATGEQVAGTGDIAFRLQWEGTADLDLMVIEPSGHRIWFGDRQSVTGGLLDIDCNFQTICSHPIENIFWPKGKAPTGTYGYQVALANLRGAALPIVFTVSVLHGKRVVSTEKAEIRHLGEVWGPRDALWRR